MFLAKLGPCFLSSQALTRPQQSHKELDLDELWGLRPDTRVRRGGANRGVVSLGHKHTVRVHGLPWESCPRLSWPLGTACYGSAWRSWGWKWVWQNNSQKLQDYSEHHTGSCLRRGTALPCAPT